MIINLKNTLFQNGRTEHTIGALDDDQEHYREEKVLVGNSSRNKSFETMVIRSVLDL